MKTSLTTISAKQWDFVTQENLTAREAVIFLKSGLQVRSFADNLREICKDKNLEQTEKMLVENLYRLYELEGEERRENTGIKFESVRKKVYNWVSGKSMLTDRQEVFRICFALELNLEQSEKMLCRLTEQGIHYRNKREVILAYCLKNRLGFDKALFLIKQLEADGKKDNPHSCEEETGKGAVTQILKLQFAEVKKKKDLFSFIMEHQADMGNSHNTAYQYFQKMLAILSGEDKELEGEAIYSIEKVAADYLRLNMPLDKKTDGYSNVQKIIKKYWPQATAVKAMKCRKQEVNRKTLLLLYIVTGGVWDKEYTEFDESYVGNEEVIENHCNRMNQMLRECGMSPIDPRNMFDYLILYCLRPEDKIFMSERLEEVIEELYREVKTQEKDT